MDARTLLKLFDIKTCPLALPMPPVLRFYDLVDEQGNPLPGATHYEVEMPRLLHFWTMIVSQDGSQSHLVDDEGHEFRVKKTPPAETPS